MQYCRPVLHAPQTAEAPWQVASSCEKAISSSEVVLTLCVGKAWWPNCATVLQFSLVLMCRACKLTRQESEGDRTEKRRKHRHVVAYRRFLQFWKGLVQPKWNLTVR